MQTQFFTKPSFPSPCSLGERREASRRNEVSGGWDGGSFGTFRTHFELCALSFEPFPQTASAKLIGEFFKLKCPQMRLKEEW